MINNLINLANELDQRGLRKEANYLDSLITKIANPQEEAKIVPIVNPSLHMMREPGYEEEIPADRRYDELNPDWSPEPYPAVHPGHDGTTPEGGSVYIWSWPKEKAEEFYGHAIDSLGLRPWWVEVILGGFYIHWMFKPSVIEENPAALKSFLEYVGIDTTERGGDGGLVWKDPPVLNNGSIGWLKGGS